MGFRDDLISLLESQSVFMALFLSRKYLRWTKAKETLWADNSPLAMCTVFFFLLKPVASILLLKNVSQHVSFTAIP